MTVPLGEPNEYKEIWHNQFQTKDVRQKPEAFRWWEIDCANDCSGDEPSFLNSFTQATGNLEVFSFRLNTDGLIQTKGFIDVSSATSGTVAWIMPGLVLGEVDLIPPGTGSDSFSLRITTTGDETGITNATAYVDNTTGEVTVRWSSAVGIPWAFVENGFTTVPDGESAWPVNYTIAAKNHDPADAYFDWSTTDVGDTGNDRLRLRILQSGIYLIDCVVSWDDTGLDGIGTVRLGITLDGVLDPLGPDLELPSFQVGSDWNVPDGDGDMQGSTYQRVGGILFSNGNNHLDPYVSNNTGGDRGLSGVYLKIVLVELDDGDINQWVWEAL